MQPLDALLGEVHRCRICAPELPLGPNPVLQVSASAKVLIAGQAPGRKVHNSGIPFDDASGKRLRAWLGIDQNTFYDATKIAILPMGFCYPGTGKSGDLPPRPECVAQWRKPILAQMRQLEMTLVLGQYAQQYHVPSRPGSLTELVKSWQQYWPHIVPLPHPSPRNNRWLKNNPWFEIELIPQLQLRIKNILDDN